MPRWVAPSIAADMLKTSVPELMERVDRGELQMMEQGGFEFINIGNAMPMQSAPMQAASVAEPAEHPATFQIVSREEQNALMGRDEMVETLDIARMRLHSAAGRRRPMAA